MKARVTISQVISAYQAARTRNKAVGLPKELTPETGKQEKVHGEVEDYEYPSKEYLGWRLANSKTGNCCPKEWKKPRALHGHETIELTPDAG